MQVSDPLILCLLFSFHLDLLRVQLAYGLLEVVDHLILERIVRILLVQFIYQLLQLFLLLLHVNRIPFEVVVLLLLQHSIKFVVQTIDNFLQFGLLAFDLGCLLLLRSPEFSTSEKSKAQL